MDSNGAERTQTGLMFAEDLLADIAQPVALGPFTMTEEAIRDFGKQWDPLPMHVDDGGHFDSVIASGLHTLAVFQKLAVEAAYSSWAVVAGRGIRDLVLPRPVFPGDILTGWVQVNGGTATPRAVVKLDLEGHLENQDGKPVLSLHLESHVRSRTGVDVAERMPSRLGKENGPWPDIE